MVRAIAKGWGRGAVRSGEDKKEFVTECGATMGKGRIRVYML